MKSLKPSYKDIFSLKALSSLFATAYLLIMFTVYPLFMENGYVGIDESKFNFYLYTSIGGVLLLLIAGTIPLIKSFKRFESTDGFVLVFLCSTIVSFFLSINMDEAILGTKGWFMGLVSIVIYIFVYILISRLFEVRNFVIYVSLVVAAIVYLLALFDRFSLYIIPLSPRAPSFVSTIGNINWLMGYYSVFTPVGVGLFLCELKEKGWNKRAYYLLSFSIIAFMAGFAQGSESVFLFDAALFTGLIVMALKGIINLKDVFLTLALWSVAAQIVRIFRVVYPKGYNYDSDGLCGMMTSTNITLFVAIGSYLIYLALKRYISEKNERIACRSLLWLIFGCFVSWVVVGILNTKGIITNIDNSLLVFNEQFGHGRGEAYKVSVQGFGRMSLVQKLFGVGPDCLGQYLYSIPEICSEIIAFWPNDRLANAHCELLTLLINGGLFGMLSYLGIFLSFITNTLRKHKNDMIWCITLSAFTYIVHNLISFSNVINTPFIFILMGIGMSLKLNSD